MHSVVTALNVYWSGFVSKFIIIVPLHYNGRVIFDLLITVHVESLVLGCQKVYIASPIPLSIFSHENEYIIWVFVITSSKHINNLAKWTFFLRGEVFFLMCNSFIKFLFYLLKVLMILLSTMIKITLMNFLLNVLNSTLPLFLYCSTTCLLHTILLLQSKKRDLFSPIWFLTSK